MDATPPADSPWPEWIRYTLTALSGFVLALVGWVRAWSAVKTNADIGAALAPRVQRLETKNEVDDERWRNHLAVVDEMRSDLKAIRAKVAP